MNRGTRPPGIGRIQTPRYACHATCLGAWPPRHNSVASEPPGGDSTCENPLLLAYMVLSYPERGTENNSLFIECPLINLGEVLHINKGFHPNIFTIQVTCWRKLMVKTEHRYDNSNQNPPALDKPISLPLQQKFCPMTATRDTFQKVVGIVAD